MNPKIDTVIETGAGFPNKANTQNVGHSNRLTC
jgi:hypothetical protein